MGTVNVKLNWILQFDISGYDFKPNGAYFEQSGIDSHP